jgi:hypothetical protein
MIIYYLLLNDEPMPLESFPLAGRKGVMILNIAY